MNNNIWSRIGQNFFCHIECYQLGIFRWKRKKSIHYRKNKHFRSYFFTLPSVKSMKGFVERDIQNVSKLLELVPYGDTAPHLLPNTFD